jgi:hypothetical protein
MGVNAMRVAITHATAPTITIIDTTTLVCDILIVQTSLKVFSFTNDNLNLLGELNWRFVSESFLF